MKIYFPKDRLEAFLTTKGDARWIIAFVIICFLAGLCGSYFLGKHFGLLAIMLLGVVGILLAAAGYAWLNWNKIDTTSAAPIKKSVPRIRSGWDYRPRNAIRRSTAIDDVATETAEVLGSSARNENDYVWFDALECSADILVDPTPDDRRVQDESDAAVSPDIVITADTADNRTVSKYD